ncbi:MAG: hypothetical protein KKE94_06770 [Gammaproteobacteria bacterium]|nr:hypothetical protein [Gammaproteobacteria bacterium]
MRYLFIFLFVFTCGTTQSIACSDNGFIERYSNYIYYLKNFSNGNFDDDIYFLWDLEDMYDSALSLEKTLKRKPRNGDYYSFPDIEDFSLFRQPFRWVGYKVKSDRITGYKIEQRGADYLLKISLQEPLKVEGLESNIVNILFSKNLGIKGFSFNFEKDTLGYENCSYVLGLELSEL